MRYDEMNIAVDYGDTKQAALYFDHVLPLLPGLTVFESADEYDGDEFNKVLGKIIPPSLLREKGDIPDVDYTTYVLYNMIDLHVGEAGADSADQYSKIVERCGLDLEKTPVVAERKFLEVLEPTKSGGQEKLCLALTNANLVDVSNVSWRQILAFREDKESRKKLRNLRLFFLKNYDGKDSSFVREDLFRLMEEYEEACKEWGFSTKISTLAMILSSKSLITTLGVSGMSILFGHGELAAVSAASGACLELGKVAVELRKRKYALNRLKSEHPLAYIIEAKERLRRKE